MPSKDWNKISNAIGIGAVLLCFVVAGGNILLRKTEAVRRDGVTIRVGHSFVDDSFRDALDVVIQNYERLRAESGEPVYVEANSVPPNVYPQWLRTQVIGGTAPELLYLSVGDPFFKAQNFLVLETLIDKPNPYNEGTEMEGLNWRLTFFDSLRQSGYDYYLGQHYAVPISSSTTRLAVNKKLLRNIVEFTRGPNAVSREGGIESFYPTTYQEFLTLCQATREYARAHKLELAPIAGSRLPGLSNAGTEYLFNQMMSSQTQRLLVRDDIYGLIRAEWPGYEVLSGDFTIDDPLFRRGFELQREIALQMQPGFYQMSPNEALFYFTQGRSLMITCNVVEYSLMQEMISEDFEIGAFPVPVPSQDHPEYGDQILGGPIAEGESSAIAEFGIVAYHPDKRVEAATDFLRYLTSVPGNRIFVQESGWLPSIRTVEPKENVAAFMPVIEGYPAGPQPAYHFQDPGAAVRAYRHILFGPKGGVEPYMDQLVPAYLDAFAGDFPRQMRRNHKSNKLMDTPYGAFMWEYYYDPVDSEAAFDRMGFLLDAGAWRERQLYRNKAPYEALFGKPLVE